ncbi:MAG: DUF2066 domain-containing protein [Pseudomonadota bacterium]
MHASAIFRLHRLVLVMCLLFPIAALAQGASLRVADIPVSARADDAVQAQIRAIEQGQRRGLVRLLERLTGESGQAMPSLEDRDIEEFVSSFEVLNETVGPGTYEGTLAVTYDRAAVEALLRDEGLGFVREAGPPAVLVPLWETGSGLLLWERDNLWKDAIDRSLDDGSLARFVVPLGDLQDLSLLDADQAVRADPAALERIAERYGTTEVVLARLRGSGEADASLTLEATRHGGASEAPYRSVVRRDPGEPLEASLARAVREMQASFAQRVRERSTVPGGPRETLVVLAPVGDASGWGRLRRDLEGLVEVEASSVRRLTRREAMLALDIAGGTERLQASLARIGWRLVQDEGEGPWRLVPGSAAPETVPPS